jgi:hypothetical protein
VGHQIDFGEARPLDVPTIGLDGNMMFQQSTWFSVAVELFLALVPFRLQSVIDSTGEADSCLVRNFVRCFPSRSKPFERGH